MCYDIRIYLENGLTRCVMKKKIILMGIYLVAIALVLALTIVTFAWYTSNKEVNVTPTSVVSMKIDGAGIEDVIDNFEQYKGETGIGGGDDAPYVATKILNVEQVSSNANDVLTCNFKSFSVRLPSGKEVVDDAIDKHFTFRISVVEINDKKEVTNVLGTFYPSSDGIVVDEAGKALKYRDESYFTVTGSSLKSTCSTYVQLQLIFLDEQSYQLVTDGVANEETPTPFHYSGYEYMGSTFFASFELGMDTLNVFDKRI